MSLKSFAIATLAVLSFSTAALAENTGTIVQNGNGNLAGMTQVGRHNNGAIGQNGDGNLARLRQLGF